MIAPDEPFLHSVKKRWIPPEMTTAPALDPNEPANGIEPHYALLINPFYAKDANASFGKHVLTPTLVEPRTPSSGEQPHRCVPPEPCRCQGGRGGPPLH